MRTRSRVLTQTLSGALTRTCSGARANRHLAVRAPSVRRLRFAPLAVALLAGAAACSSATGGTVGTASSGTITAIGAENEYANVIQQIGGKYVTTQAIMSNPNYQSWMLAEVTALEKAVTSQVSTQHL